MHSQLDWVWGCLNILPVGALESDENLFQVQATVHVTSDVITCDGPLDIRSCDYCSIRPNTQVDRDALVTTSSSILLKDHV